MVWEQIRPPGYFNTGFPLAHRAIADAPDIAWLLPASDAEVTVPRGPSSLCTCPQEAGTFFKSAKPSLQPPASLLGGGDV